MPRHSLLALTRYHSIPYCLLACCMRQRGRLPPQQLVTAVLLLAAQAEAPLRLVQLVVPLQRCLRGLSPMAQVSAAHLRHPLLLC